MKQSSRTTKGYWDKYWKDCIEDESINPIQEKGLILQELERLINSHIKKRNLSVLEIGGAPGRICEWISRLDNVQNINIIDYSTEGIRQSELFLNNNCCCEYSIYKLDIFESNFNILPTFDIVYSLGFVEHFNDLQLSIQKHLDVTQKGGIIIIGLPVFLGVNKLIGKIFSPNNLKTHYLRNMEMRNWQYLHKMINVKVIEMNYIGGFNPNVHWRLEKRNYLNIIIYKVFHRIIKPIIYKLKILRSKNSKYFSYYMLVVLKKL